MWKCESPLAKRRKKVCDSRLAPDGTEHEIDLNAEHHWALRDALGPPLPGCDQWSIPAQIRPTGARLSPSSWVVGTPASLISGSPRATGLHVYALPTVLRTRYHAADRSSPTGHHSFRRRCAVRDGIARCPAKA